MSEKKTKTYKAKYNKVWREIATGKILGNTVKVASYSELIKYTEVPAELEPKGKKASIPPVEIGGNKA